MTGTIGRRIRQAGRAPALRRGVAAVLGGYFDLCDRTATWRVEGAEALADTVRGGQPVIILSWHGRAAFAPNGWNLDWGPLASLNSKADPGQLAAAILARKGWQTTKMRDEGGNRSRSLAVMRMMRAGVSLAVAPDGPLGPCRKMSRIPLDWARATGAPIWLMAASARRHTLLPTWDRMMLPLPWSSGVKLYRRWQTAVPRRATDDEMEALRLRLEADLDALTEEADRAAGHRGLRG